ncbi:MAG: lycopene beta-cyclase CrtY [Archangiaceae bacterium]|nr:lycopene beta-cyclase CrtY [Archangiaceae bacterium]
MSAPSAELLLVGGGLANGLLAARLCALRPEVPFTLLEAGLTLGGNHTWSFHESDVSAEALGWLAALGARRFEGHQVKLPGCERALSGAYWSLRSDDFHRALSARLAGRVRFGARVRELGARRVELEGGEVLEARGAVIDARARPPEGPCGYQKFLGQELELEAPHGLSCPLLMDATVEQLDGFRFIYVLPWSERSVLVEDTVYSDTAALDGEAFRARIAEWVRARGWRVRAVTREEQAALPIPLGGRAPRLTHPMLGVSAGFFHATTGYSLPFAVQLAERVATLPSFAAEPLTALLAREAKRHWRRQGFFRLLNRMLFRGAAPAERVRVFSSFYRHDEQLIGRFYAGSLSFFDIVKVLARGASTVPAHKAIPAALAAST